MPLPQDRLVLGPRSTSTAAAVAEGAVRALRHQSPPAPELTTAIAARGRGADGCRDRGGIPPRSSFLLARARDVRPGVVAGVVEEKNSRVVELMLAAVRPRQLLAGKVIGIGLLGLAQLAVIGVAAAVLLAAGDYRRLSGRLAAPRARPRGSARLRLLGRLCGRRGLSPRASRTPRTPGQPITYTLLAAYLRGLRRARHRRERSARERAHRVPAECADRAPRAQRSGGASLGARARRRARPRVDLCSRPARRPDLRPRPASQRPAPRVRAGGGLTREPAWSTSAPATPQAVAPGQPRAARASPPARAPLCCRR